jgi:hypothetical protein
MTASSLRSTLLCAVAGINMMAPHTKATQGRALTVDEVRSVFASGGDVFGWDEFDVPEFLAAAYGRRLHGALVAILSESSTVENYYYQLEALTTAQYARTGVPVGLLLDYASGRRGVGVGGVLRHRAMLALSMRADSTLTSFWLQQMSSSETSFRQLAAAGLSCAIGPAALGHLEGMKEDVPAVARVARFYLDEHRSRGRDARACGGRVTRERASVFPDHVRPDLLRIGRPVLERIP